MIEIKNLSKSFDGYKALDNVSLTVPTGSVYGIVGPNGAGKTTMIRNITGAYKPDDGTILFDGEPVYENTAVKENIAYICDDWYYFQSANIYEMKEFYKGIYKNFSEERFEKLSELFKIDVKRNIKTLSKGMKKQVAFWIAISTMPKYFVLDEPVDGIDPVMRKNIWSVLLEDVEKRGTTVLVSSHNLRELEDVCDHVGILDKGRVLIERSLLELQDNMSKIQVVFGENRDEALKGLNALNVSSTGKLDTVILEMNPEEALKRIAMYNPVFAEALPLTLEEIFIYEVGGENINAKDILF